MRINFLPFVIPFRDALRLLVRQQSALIKGSHILITQDRLPHKFMSGYYGLVALAFAVSTTGITPGGPWKVPMLSKPWVTDGSGA